MTLRQSLILAMILAIFGVFLIWPIGQVVRGGFFGVGGDGESSGFTFAYVAAIFRDPNLRAGLWNSLKIAVLVTILCTLISVPLAILSVRYQFVGKRWVSGLLLVPLILPPFVGAIGMRQILGRFGVLTAVAQDVGLVPHNSPVDWLGAARLLGIVVIEALGLYPILFLNVSAALANLD